MNTQPRRSAGFTLIEMVIALVLASLLSVVVVSGLHLGIRSWEAVSSNIHETNDSYVSIHALRRVLSSVRPERVRDENGVQIAAFYGRSDTVLFVAPFDQLGKPDDLYWIMLKEREDESGDRTLVLHLMPFGDTTYLDDEETVTLEEVVWEEKIDEILGQESVPLGSHNRMSAIAFEYLKLDNNGDPLWEEEWEDSTQLPRAVKVTLGYGEDTDWPALYVVPSKNSYEFKTLL